MQIENLLVCVIQEVQRQSGSMHYQIWDANNVLASVIICLPALLLLYVDLIFSSIDHFFHEAWKKLTTQT